MPNKLYLIRVATNFVVTPSKDGNTPHRIFASDGTFTLEVESYPASKPEGEVPLKAVQMASGREIRVDPDFDPADLSRFFS